ncbi:SdpI family protein [Streptomyces sp. SID6673]|nr:SdpI family protein [Streptomyces sp. SID11726]NEB26419.1 SdpI family protein [Streptomyces sp. SID6673]NED61513.1 SdpI family protein [Streptomyces sp. SID10244]
MVVDVIVLSVAAAVVVFALAALWLVVGGLGIVGRLPRNRWLGVRADESMRSDEAFQVANRVAAPGLFAAAGILVLSGIVTLGIGGYWSVAFAVVGVVAALFVVGLVSAYGVRAAAAVPADDEGCSCCSTHDHDEPAADPAGAPTDTADETHAAACGTSSCGACSLRAVCSNESAQA